MDDAVFKERVKRLQEVNKIVTKLDESIRSAAFPLLEDYVTGKAASPSHRKPKGEKPDASAPADAESFFAAFEHGKPSGNALLLAAYIFSQFGSSSFTLDEVRELANDVGLTIPERLDMTYKSAKRDSKSLFRGMGNGKYKPTVHGEALLKKEYNVKKGTKKRADGENE